MLFSLAELVVDRVNPGGLSGGFLITVIISSLKLEPPFTSSFTPKSLHFSTSIFLGWLIPSVKNNMILSLSLSYKTSAVM